uniref:Uncharacterized protein n=1 Tax=Knipowitschia caucasica TaxID=637954 RepID=A0AAV2K6H0_KNICA
MTWFGPNTRPCGEPGSTPPGSGHFLSEANTRKWPQHYALVRPWPEDESIPPGTSPPLDQSGVSAALAPSALASGWRDSLLYPASQGGLRRLRGANGTITGGKRGSVYSLSSGEEENRLPGAEEIPTQASDTCL